MRNLVKRFPKLEAVRAGWGYKSMAAWGLVRWGHGSMGACGMGGASAWAHRSKQHSLIT